MTEIDTSTAAIAALMDGVTAGPWEQDGPISAKIVWSGPDVRVCFMTSDGPASKNASFIAAARELVPALTDERDAAIARAEQAEARELALLSASEESRQFLRQRDALRAENQRLRDAANVWAQRCADLESGAADDPAIACATRAEWAARALKAEAENKAMHSGAICEAERFVGRPDDEYGALLNAVLDARTWEDHR